MNPILIVDYPLVSYGIKMFINDMFPNVKIHQAFNYADALHQLSKIEMALVIMDRDLPGGADLDLIQTFRTIQSEVRILVFSGSDEKEYGISYINAGANGFLSKGASNEEYQFAIDTVMKDRKYLSTNVLEMVIDSFNESNIRSKNENYGLSAREEEIMRLILEGYRTKDIADQLNLKMPTISAYKTNLLKKMNVSSLVHLVEKSDSFKHRSPAYLSHCL